MSISPRSMCRWSSVLGLIGVAALAADQPPQKPKTVPPFLDEFQASKPRDLPLFLDDFKARTDPPVLTEDVVFLGEGGGPFGSFTAFWARVEGKQALPAVLLAYNDASLATWMQTNARHLASIGYAVLAIPLNYRPVQGDLFGIFNKYPERQLSAGMRWLRGRADVLPNRLGVVGFGGPSGREALHFASSRAVQACVVCDPFVPTEPSVIRGLRGTPVLAVYGADGGNDVLGFAWRLTKEQIPHKLHAAPKARPGFLGPPNSETYNHDAAEDAWVAIYNFLEKHVEDARPAEGPARPAKSIATIADIMRAVNEPAGLRGR